MLKLQEAPRSKFAALHRQCWLTICIKILKRYEKQLHVRTNKPTNQPTNQTKCVTVTYAYPSHNLTKVIRMTHFVVPFASPSMCASVKGWETKTYMLKQIMNCLLINQSVIIFLNEIHLIYQCRFIYKLFCVNESNDLFFNQLIKRRSIGSFCKCSSVVYSNTGVGTEG